MELLVYVDLDGTICGKSEWRGLVSNTISLFSGKILFNPNEYFKDWALMTARPLVDKPIIKILCLIKSLAPTKIITCNRYVWNYGCIISKVEELVQISRRNLDKVVYYIDSDRRILDLCNIYGQYNLVSLSPNDRKFKEMFPRRRSLVSNGR